MLSCIIDVNLSGMAADILRAFVGNLTTPETSAWLWYRLNLRRPKRG